VRCPYCHYDNDRVLDTRPADGGFTVRRKRVCSSCNRKFSTAETIEKLSVQVLKSDDSRQPLDRDKIRRGIARACSKRPINSDTIDRVVQDIEADIFSSYGSEVTSSQLGDIVMKHLVKLDEVAYIRFASVYHEFDDAQDFVRAVSKMIGPKMATSR
jgi:transcriptional repressor NrdR